MAHPTRPHSRVRGALVGVAVLALLTAPTAASAHHQSRHAAPTATEHAHHTAADTAATKPTEAVPTTAASSSSMFVVADPKNPRIAKGPNGPLWAAYTPIATGKTSLGRTFAQAYLAKQAAKAKVTAAEPVAEKTKVLTTAQATKKLSKKCQRLVKIVKAKDLKKLKKSDRKARTKCLEQRRKLIADSKKPETKPGGSTNPSSGGGGSTNPTTGGGSTTPGTGGGTTNPGMGGGTTNPDTPGSTTPTNPTPTTPTNPTPTTPTNPSTPTCSPLGTSPISVTAIDEGSKFEVNTACVKAGTIQFRFKSDDEFEDHNLLLFNTNSAGNATGSPRVIQADPIDKNHSTVVQSFSLPAGDYLLICTVEGHSAMTVKIRVLA